MYVNTHKMVAKLVIAALWTATAMGGIEPALCQEKPNVIFILVDDLGYGDLGCYGQDRIKTPNIDRLAAEGIRFTQHYAGSTVCAPSRAAFMTGLHTGHAVVRGNSEVQPMGQFPLPGTTTTAAKVFKAAGYRTALIGKWGLGGPGSTGHPNLQGFDYFFGYLCQRHAHNYYPEFLYRNDQKVLLDNELPEPRRPDGAGVAIRKEQYSHDLLASEALQYIEENRQQPFFLFLAFTIPHANNEGGDSGMEVPDLGMYAEKDWPESSKALAAMISRMDADVGRLMEKLKTLGLEKNTLILFSSDNGPHREGGNDPGYFNSSGSLRGIKRDLYEGGIRVPLIARWPGKIAAGRVSDHVSAHWDFLPTICQLTGTEEPELLDGISYLPELLGREQLSHDYLYWEFHEGGGAQAVRSGNWKAVRNRVFENASGPVELFNLDLDPGEQKDISSQHPEITRMMEGIMRSAHYEDLNWPFLNR